MTGYIAEFAVLARCSSDPGSVGVHAGPYPLFLGKRNNIVDSLQRMTVTGQ